MSDFTFNMADVAPQTEVVVATKLIQSRIAKSQTDDARIADAKARLMARSKANSADPIYGSHTHQSYWQDFAAPETSAYMFDQLMFQLGFLEDPKWEYLSHNYRDGNYNRRTGIWTRGDQQISIQDLKDSLAQRIAELSISEMLLAEYLAVPHSWQEDKAFWNLSFEERMLRFKQGQ
jgi:hypothetical protein